MVVSVYSSAETGMCKNGQLQYGYFITRVAICSPPPFKNPEYQNHYHRQKTTRVTPKQTPFDPDLHMRPPCQQHSQLWTVRPVSAVGPCSQPGHPDRDPEHHDSDQVHHRMESHICAVSCSVSARPIECNTMSIDHAHAQAHAKAVAVIEIQRSVWGVGRRMSGTSGGAQVDVDE